MGAKDADIHRLECQVKALKGDILDAATHNSAAEDKLKGEIKRLKRAIRTLQGRMSEVADVLGRGYVTPRHVLDEIERASTVALLTLYAGKDVSADFDAVPGEVDMLAIGIRAATQDYGVKE